MQVIFPINLNLLNKYLIPFLQDFVELQSLFIRDKNYDTIMLAINV
jgi:hypothetical protein